jgi:hypothetical protein
LGGGEEKAFLEINDDAKTKTIRIAIIALGITPLLNQQTNTL